MYRVRFFSTKFLKTELPLSTQSLYPPSSDTALLFVGGSFSSSASEVLVDLEDAATRRDVFGDLPAPVVWASGQW